MNVNELEGKFIVLDYSFGPFWNEETGGEDVLTIWQIKNGRLEQRYHPGEPDIVDYQRPIDLLKKKRCKASLYSFGKFVC